jgi:kinesin family protein 5
MLYHCDQTFGPDASQENVYQQAVTPICEAVIRGYNGAVIAYGQTGSGKTHTMIGNTRGARGVALQAVEELFDALRSRSNWTVEVSVLEIYNERVRDLLAAAPGITHVDIHETCGNDANISFRCPEATAWKASTPDDALAALAEGMRRRETARTDMNHNSSRSHLIFTLCTTQSDDDMGAILRGRLHLVDLAGSERLKRSMSSDNRSFRPGNTPRSPRDQRREAGEINKSLSQLALVIQRLTNPSFSSLQYVPYRDSMLTRLLAECFGGNSKTCVIITCSTLAKDREETRSSLEFGRRAKQVKNKAEINLELTHDAPPVLQALLQKELQRELGELQRERQELMQERDTLAAERNFLQKKLSASQDLMKEAANEVISLQDRRLEETRCHEDEKSLLQQRHATALESANEAQVGLATQITELQNARLALHGQLLGAATEIAHLRKQHSDTVQQHREEIQCLQTDFREQAKELDFAREQAATFRSECAAIRGRWAEEVTRLENDKLELAAKAEIEKDSLRKQLEEAMAELAQQHDDRMRLRVGSAAIVAEATAAAKLAEEDGAMIEAQSSQKLVGLRSQLESVLAETSKAEALRKARIAESEAEHSARKNRWRQAIENATASENAVPPGEIAESVSGTSEGSFADRVQGGQVLQNDARVNGTWPESPPMPKCLNLDLDTQSPDIPHKLLAQSNNGFLPKERGSSAEPFPEPFPGLRQ